MKEAPTRETKKNSGREEQKKPKRTGRKTRYPGVKRVSSGCRIELKVVDPKTGKRRARDRFVPGVGVEEASRIRATWRDELLQVKQTAKPVTLSDCGRSWLKHCARSGEARSTLEDKTSVLERYILPRLGDHYVRKLDRKDLKAWIQEVSRLRKPNGDRYAEQSVLAWWRRLKSLVRWSVEELDLETDPTSRIDPRKHLHKELRVAVQLDKGTNALTADELQRFLPVAKKLRPQHYAMIVIGFFTGMRWSELSALRWEHFNLDTMEIEIHETQFRGTRRTRTKSRRRRGPAFDDFMWQVMQEHRQRLVREQAPGVDSGLCFPSKTGGYRLASLLTKPFALICREAGITKTLTSKCFRRTYNDLCRRAGVKGLVLRAMIGHSDQRMSEIYASIDPSEKRAALAQVVEIVRSRG